MDLREYRVLLNGVETTALLNDADAKLLSGVLVDEEPEPDEDDVLPTTKARTVYTAARTARNKGR